MVQLMVSSDNSNSNNNSTDQQQQDTTTASKPQMTQQLEKHQQPNNEIDLHASMNGNGADFDLELIEETRALIRDEFKLNGGAQVYSARHYAEILDARSPATCWRYLAHCNRSPKEACELMKLALAWRQRDSVDAIGPQQLAKDFWLKAPIGITGRTSSGHELIYVVGKNYRKPDGSVKPIVRQMVAYLLADFDRRHRHDLDKFVAVFDVGDTTLANIDLDFVSWLISIRDYFPARFEAVHILGIPFLIRPVIRLIISWLPENYRRITHCGTLDQLLKEGLVDEHSLPSEVGGLASDTYRLAPPEAPWLAESVFTSSVEPKLNQAISFNTPAARLEQLYEMQREHEHQQQQQQQQQHGARA